MVARDWVDVKVFDHLSLEAPSSIDGNIELVELEPQQDPVTVSAPIGIHEVGMILSVPRVERKDEGAVNEQSVVEVGVIGRHQFARAHCVQESRIPAGACGHVANGEYGLGPDGRGHTPRVLRAAPKVSQRGPQKGDVEHYGSCETDGTGRPERSRTARGETRCLDLSDTRRFSEIASLSAS